MAVSQYFADQQAVVHSAKVDLTVRSSYDGNISYICLGSRSTRILDRIQSATCSAFLPYVFPQLQTYSNSRHIGSVCICSLVS